MSCHDVCYVVPSFSRELMPWPVALKPQKTYNVSPIVQLAWLSRGTFKPGISVQTLSLLAKSNLSTWFNTCQFSSLPPITTAKRSPKLDKEKNLLHLAMVCTGLTEKLPSSCEMVKIRDAFVDRSLRI